MNRTNYMTGLKDFQFHADLIEKGFQNCSLAVRQARQYRQLADQGPDPILACAVYAFQYWKGKAEEIGCQAGEMLSLGKGSLGLIYTAVWWS